MGIKEQMEAAGKFSILEAESKTINDNIFSLTKEISDFIKNIKESICNKIKSEILDQGKSNNFDIIDKGDNWSMKYQNLEYKGHFSSDIKCVERINGTTYSKIEFVLETEKRMPDRSISLMGPFKNEFEKKEKQIAAEKSILENLQKYKDSMNEKSVVIKYTMGKRDVIRASEMLGENTNYHTIKMDELIKMIIG